MLEKLLWGVVFLAILAIGGLAFWKAEPLLSDSVVEMSGSYLEVLKDFEGPRYLLHVGNNQYPFDLIDPEMAPASILEQVLYGNRLMLDTHRLAPQYAKDRITCNNCHFNSGNSLGGKNNGISLVGVTTLYPSYSRRNGTTITLAGRIGNCFRRSLNGISPSEDSREMQAMLAYLSWISSEVEKFPKPLPWLGLKPIKSAHTPDLKRGEAIYLEHCAACHQANGHGAKDIPPLWGPHAFNDGAGMNTLPKLGRFVLDNMPRENPILTEEEALDVSAYLIAQPRPSF